MRTFFVLLLMGVACSGTTSTTPPPVGAGSQPIRTAQPAPAPEVDQKTVEDGPPPGVKAPGNLPVRTRAELEAEAEALNACLDACEETDGACRQACFVEHPIEQVEVVDGPLDPPDIE